MHGTALSACCLLLFVITAVLFGTDLILYFDHAVYVSLMLCLTLVINFPALMAHLLQNVEDLLSVLCGHNILSNDLHEFLLNGTTKRACFIDGQNK
jgi:hypothetical protein